MSLKDWPLDKPSIKFTEKKNTVNIAFMKNGKTLFDESGQEYQKLRMKHWDEVAVDDKKSRSMGKWYHRRLEKVYKSIVPPNQRVLEIGCGKGGLLAALEPSYGMGVDFSGEMIEYAQEKYPNLHFIQSDVHNLSKIKETFDIVILSDVINDMWDVQRVLEQIIPLCHRHTRLVINFFSHLWKLPLSITQTLNLSKPNLEQNWFTPEDVRGLLHVVGLETIRSSREVLWPLPLGGFANRFLVRIPPFKALALTNIIVARPLPKRADNCKVSVIVPARNESGNIKDIFKRIPKMGQETELIFIEGHSKDDTFNTIKNEMAEHPMVQSKLFKQTGIGKGDAVQLGFSKATGDILMILDADLTVPPEDLPRFYEALVSGKGEFINGVRLVYPMQHEAMRMLNLIGNKIFSLTFSWILGQSIKDTLCGTKVLWKKDYEKIAENRSYFGEFDPFGDYDLIFGAAKLNLKIVDIPIRYRQRFYGSTNISRWKHGWLLLRMVIFAAWRIKFI